jgi:UDP-glucose 4-epimerase
MACQILTRSVKTVPFALINSYGASKMMAERIFQGAEAAFGLRTIKLRYFKTSGANPDSEIGERHDPETHLIPLTLRAALPGEFTLKIMGKDYPTRDGSAVRDYVYVVDLADAHLVALRRLQDGGGSGAFNLGVGRGFSVKDVIRAGEKISGRPVRVESAPRRAGDPPELVADATEAKTALGWRPKHTALNHIAADALRWEMGLVFA